MLRLRLLSFIPLQPFQVRARAAMDRRRAPA
ncbi:hypothetical protein D8I24_7263 [Cupriavidus necator H850]|nr:hypothetical protein D8I24_7263 [Cupriavidus necator H850]